jgi:hypothetical protein
VVEVSVTRLNWQRGQKNSLCHGEREIQETGLCKEKGHAAVAGVDGAMEESWVRLVLIV